MGLSSGDRGVKTVVRERFPGSVASFGSLREAREGVQAERRHAVLTIDGNVLLFNVPRGPVKLDAYEALVTSAVRAALASAWLVVVVFDEPELMTSAKAEEQRRRDESKARTMRPGLNGMRRIECSADFDAVAGPRPPVNDDYTLAELRALDDVFPLVTQRSTRCRLFDAVMCNALEKLRPQIERWNHGSSTECHDNMYSAVLLDGIDARGAERPIGAPRVPTIFGTDDSLASAFTRDVDELTGEGDIKLSLIDKRTRELHAARVGRFTHVTLCLTVTIDTDSIAIGLLDAARRRADTQRAPFASKVRSLLCMRERAPASSSSAATSVGVTYLCVDTQQLHECMQDALWGTARPRTLVEERQATTLLVAGWVMAGSDFVKISGLHADVVCDTLMKMVRSDAERPMLSLLDAVDRGDRHACLKEPQTAVRRLMVMCAETMEGRPRTRAKSIASVRDADRAQIGRAVWTAAYWGGHEFRGELHEFGFACTSSSQS